MLWFFERENEILRIDTTHEPAGQFVLTIHQSNTTQQVERFASKPALQKRLEALERQPLAERWKPTGVRRIAE